MPRLARWPTHSLACVATPTCRSIARRRAAHGGASVAGPADAVWLPVSGCWRRFRLATGAPCCTYLSREPGCRCDGDPGREDRQDPEAIGALLLRSAQGLLLPLRELAEIYPSSGRYSCTDVTERSKLQNHLGPASSMAMTEVVISALLPQSPDLTE